MKQRRIKPGADHNYSDAVYVVADGVEIPEHALCVVSGVEGSNMKVVLADMTNEATARGRLWIAKHLIPANQRGVVVPWMLIPYDTSGKAVGDILYLDKDGGLSDTAPSIADEWERPVGTVAHVAEAGRVLLDPNVDPGVVVVSI